MLAGAAIVPAAPLLVPGVTARLADGVAAVREAVDEVVAALPPSDLLVLVGVGAPAGTYAAEVAGLAGFGRPDLAVTLVPAAGDGLAGPLPPALAVLAMLTATDRPVLPVAVDPDQTADDLAAQGTALAADPRRVVLVAAGDCSAGLGERAPRYVIEGAAEWDAALRRAISDDDPAALADLGPDEARRVHALGWAPMVVARAALGRPFAVRRYAAPRGVGYLVAHG